jgi:hypothetical protein
LPAKGDGLRWANSDPITGQAAWFDLRVHVARAEPDEPAEVAPQFDVIATPPDMPTPAATLRYGLEWTVADKTKTGDR